MFSVIYLHMQIHAKTAIYATHAAIHPVHLLLLYIFENFQCMHETAEYLTLFIVH